MSEAAVRIEPDFDHRVHGARSVSAYFEIAHLATGADGLSRFSYVYALRPAVIMGATGERARRAFEATRDEEYAGSLRRQFVTIPLNSIKDGEYDLEVEVRDLIAGTTATGSVRFVKE